MHWRHIETNWEGLRPAIMGRWPEADEDELIRLEGDHAGFIAYIAEITGQEPEDAAGDIRDWAAGEVPADAVMDEHHDNQSILQSERYVPDGEDPSDDDGRFGDDGKDEPPVGRD